MGLHNYKYVTKHQQQATRHFSQHVVKVFKRIKHIRLRISSSTQSKWVRCVCSKGDRHGIDHISHRVPITVYNRSPQPFEGCEHRPHIALSLRAPPTFSTMFASIVKSITLVDKFKFKIVAKVMRTLRLNVARHVSDVQGDVACNYT